MQTDHVKSKPSSGTVKKYQVEIETRHGRREAVYPECEGQRVDSLHIADARFDMYRRAIERGENIEGRALATVEALVVVAVDVNPSAIYRSQEEVAKRDTRRERVKDIRKIAGAA